MGDLDLSQIPTEQLMQMAGVGAAPTAAGSSDLSSIPTADLLKMAGVEQPGVLDSALRGVRDTPRALINTPAALYGLGSDIYSGVTAPSDSLVNGTTERAVRGTGLLGAGLAGGGAGAAIGAEAGAFGGPIGAAVGGVAGGALGGAAGLLGFNKVLQWLGVDPETAPQSDLNSLAYNTAQGAASDVGLRGARVAAGKTADVLSDWSRELDRKSIGAQYGDYKRTANDLQMIDTPDAGIETATKIAVDDLLSGKDIPYSRKPQAIMKAVSSAEDTLSRQIGEVIKAKDATITEPVLPDFENALNFVADGKVPADLVPKYLAKIENLGDAIKRDGGGRLSYLQQQKIAIGKNWDTEDGVLNAFNRALYKDLRTTIEAVAPEVKPLNLQLQKYKLIEPIAKRSLATAEGSDPISRFINIGKTTGGYGLPIAALGHSFGLPGMIAGYGAGAAINNLSGKAILSDIAGAGSRGSSLVDALAGHTSPYIIPALSEMEKAQKESQLLAALIQSAQQ